MTVTLQHVTLTKAFTLDHVWLGLHVSDLDTAAGYLDTRYRSVLSCHFILPAGQPRARAGCVLIKQKDAASLYFVNHPSFSGDIFTSPVPEQRVVTRIKIVGLRIDNGSGGCADNGTDFCAIITPSQSPVPGDPPCPAQPPTRCKHFL